MKILRFATIAQVPASHEDPNDPGVLKKVLFRRDELFAGRIQMVNWATLLPGKSFRLHYHEDMQEVFIMMTDGAVATVNGENISLSRGDALVVDVHESHEMENPTDNPIEYIVVGIAGEKMGKSVNV
jgi:mannose-6-phosphate isomerase-like protein (cupin superfamily)